MRSRRLPDAWFPRLWVAWVVGNAVTFAALEAHALMTTPRTPRDSLSRNLQWWLCKTPFRRMTTAATWVLFAGWLLHHVWMSYVEETFPRE